MITGIAWIGASFYFIWLDNHLQKPADSHDQEKGVGGELWAVHGGGFYHAQKYKVAPKVIPENLHWFKWEAYTTWLSGMFMLGLIYWYSAELYLIDPSIADLSKPIAIAISIGFIAAGWLVYHNLCNSPIGRNDKLLSATLFVLLVIAAWALCHVFSGRAAYIHFGAILGTIMVGNVFFVIMPGQRAMVSAAEAGKPPNPEHGIRAKQRSVHNTYFTLPVLFVMISNHYAMTYGHQWNWLILIAISLAGAFIRIYFVNRHFAYINKETASPLPLIIGIAILLLVSLGVSLPQQPEASTQKVSDEAFFAVIQQRCATCHSAKPSMAGFQSAPAGVVLDTLADSQQYADKIYQQTVVTKAMPLGNMTQITDEERSLIQQWYLSFANSDGEIK